MPSLTSLMASFVPIGSKPLSSPMDRGNRPTLGREAKNVLAGPRHAPSRDGAKQMRPAKTAWSNTARHDSRRWGGPASAISVRRLGV